MHKCRLCQEKQLCHLLPAAYSLGYSCLHCTIWSKQSLRSVTQSQIGSHTVVTTVLWHDIPKYFAAFAQYGLSFGGCKWPGRSDALLMQELLAMYTMQAKPSWPL